MRTAVMAVMASWGLLAGCAGLGRPPATVDTFAAGADLGSGVTRLPEVAQAAPAPEGPMVHDPAEAPPPVRSAAHEFRWRDHPFSGGYQLGILSGDPLEKGNHDNPNGLFVAKRYGWDFADHWGVEMRLADAWLSESNRFNPNALQTERVLFWDTSLMYYPWGETRLRPYATFGAGVADFHYRNELDRKVDRVLIDLPFGVGVKYPLNDWLAVRAELIDNLAIGNGRFPAMDNISLSGGVELRFGDLRKHFSSKRSRSTSSASGENAAP